MDERNTEDTAKEGRKCLYNSLYFIDTLTQ